MKDYANHAQTVKTSTLIRRKNAIMRILAKGSINGAYHDACLGIITRVLHERAVK